MNYDQYKYLFPPRPDLAVPVSALTMYDKQNKFVAQPKLNGSCTVLFMNETETVLMTRHNEPFKRKPELADEEFHRLYKGSGWMVLVGEYMNKSQANMDNIVFNQKFVVFDILVFNGVQLLGYSVEARLALLESLYGDSRAVYDDFIDSILGNQNLYLVKWFTEGFTTLFDMMKNSSMYEGLVLKKRSAKLSQMDREKGPNNVTQLKFRKPTRKYTY